MVKNSAASLLTSVDELFTTQTQREEAGRKTVQEILLGEIRDFPNHPFQVRMDAAMEEMTQSIRQYGVLVPALVRPTPEGGYEMIAGHRRRMASELAGKATLACIVRALTDDEATILMVDSNLQREQVLPSEKAFAYKMKLEAMKRQGQRTDLTSAPLGQKFRPTSSEMLAQNSPDSDSQIQRYIRLTHLIPELLELVDNSILKENGVLQMALRPAVELSYLAEEEQRTLLTAMECEACTPSYAQSVQLRHLSQKGMLYHEAIRSILQEKKPNQTEQFKMPRDRISKYFPPGTPAQKIEDTIIKALEFYRKRQRDMTR